MKEENFLSLADSLVIDQLNISNEQKTGLHVLIAALHGLQGFCMRKGLSIAEVTPAHLVTWQTNIQIDELEFQRSRLLLREQLGESNG